MRTLEIGRMINRDVFNAFSSVYQENRKRGIEVTFDHFRKRHRGIALKEIREMIIQDYRIGLSRKEIADKYEFSLSTIDYHITNYNRQKK